MSIDAARSILEASKQRAKELRSPVSIAIVDAGGHLVLFERMMTPYGWATGNISIAKASTAVMFNQSTDAVAQWGSGIPGFASSMAEMSHGKFIMAAGGWPIRIGGATVGGIGVSGGNAPGRDDEIARAGLGALEASAPAIPAQSPQPQLQSASSAMFSQSQSQSQPHMQQQHSRPYMQPAPSYPSIPVSNSGVNQPQNASGDVQLGAQANIPLSTQNLAEQEEENPYNDQVFPPYNDSRSGGQS